MAATTSKLLDRVTRCLFVHRDQRDRGFWTSILAFSNAAGVSWRARRVLVQTLRGGLSSTRALAWLFGDFAFDFESGKTFETGFGILRILQKDERCRVQHPRNIEPRTIE